MQNDMIAAKPQEHGLHKNGEGMPSHCGHGKETHRLQAQREPDVLRRHAEHARHKAARARQRLFAEYGENTKRGRPPKGEARPAPTVKSKNLPATVEALIRAYCADYDRRARIVAAAEEEAEKRRREAGTQKKESPLPLGVDPDKLRITVRRANTYPAPLVNRLRETNDLIDEALAATCDEGLTEVMRHDLGERLGHRRTSLYFVGSGAYLRQKRRAKLAIAAALELM